MSKNRPTNTIKQHWLNKEVKSAIRNKYKSWRKDNGMRNEKNLANYHKQRNIATSIKRKSKQNYEIKIVEGIQTDKKQFTNMSEIRLSLKLELEQY